MVADKPDVWVSEGTGRETLGVRVGVYRRVMTPDQARAFAVDVQRKADLAEYGNTGKEHA